jgi:hypothetical protein
MKQGLKLKAGISVSFKVSGRKSRYRTGIRVFMFGRFRHFLTSVACGMGIATIGASAATLPQPLAQPGYLPQAGPEPLRFRAVPPPVPEPPAAPVPPPPAPIVLPSPAMPSTPKESANPPIQSPTIGPELDFNAREAEKAPVPASPPDTVISPQMFLKYFAPSSNGATNAPVTGTVPGEPVGFQSPISAPSPAQPPPPAKAP